MLARMIGAARLSADTYEDVEHDKGATIQALGVVIIVSLAAFVGGLLADEDTEVLNALVFGLVSGVVGWALWALFTYMIGTTILKTEDTEADWGQLARGIGFAQTPGILHVFILHTYGRASHLSGGTGLEDRGHGGRRAAEPGLYVDSPGGPRDPDRLHSSRDRIGIVVMILTGLALGEVGGTS